ncbi:hypothetical protein [Xenorhabdus bovienii]|uniref:Uncharacterized protein n=1 Tax=Xenorhabdus bovienii TaxID=40576 RepID=A0A0B6X1N9_XENBV|nr:hypothetical protein [Xenorhabdus bovienii]CDM87642.1 conserved protein of unknown function [Xenorhabdus bovienii]
MENIAKNPLTASLNQQADLIIGQSFVFILTLIPDALLPATIKVNFTKATNITPPTGNLEFTAVKNKDGKIIKYTYVTILTVSDALTEQEQITFNVDTTPLIPNITPLEFKCNLKKINPDSLELSIDNVFLDTFNFKNSSVTNKTKVSTILTDKSGKTLSGVPIYIDSFRSNNLHECTIKDNNGNIITPQQFYTYDGLFLNSESDGSIVFYIYPEKSLSMVLDLRCSVIDAFDYIPATSPLFFINTERPNPMDSLREPDILGGFPGPLTSNTGEPNFYVSIDNYDNSKRGDYIVFMIKTDNDTTPKYSGYYVSVSNPNTELGQGKYSYSLPYDIFNISINYEFSYIVIFGEAAGSKTSRPYPVTYMGGAIYNPPTNVTRDYDLCKVYTSLGIGKAEIQPDTGISYDSIKRYLDNPSTPNTGLFVEVLGGNNIPGKVPLNSKVTLNVYIQSSNCNTHKSWTLPMPTQVGSQGIVSLSFHIPFDFLNKIYPYDNGGPGSIYFDYEFNIGNKKNYGEIWEGLIDTRPE